MDYSEWEAEQAYLDALDDEAQGEYEWDMYILEKESEDYADDTDLPWGEYLNGIPF